MLEYWSGQRPSEVPELIVVWAASSSTRCVLVVLDNQYQFGALYYFRDSGNTWRPYVAGSAGFTHDSNSGENPARSAVGFGLGGDVTYEFSSHFGLRTDARWMPTYGSNGTGSTCDEFGNCYPALVRNYLQRFHVAIGLTIHP